MSTERIFTMRAPNGETAEVSEREVDHFRKKGAVVIGLSRQGRDNWIADKLDQPELNRSVPQARLAGFTAGATQSAADLLEGAKAGVMSTAYHGGDLIRRALGIKRVIDDPDAVDAMTPPDSTSGRIGFYGEQGAEYIAPGARAMRAAGRYGRAATMGAGMAADAGWAGVQTGGDPTSMVVAAAAPPVIAGAGKALGATGRAIRRAAGGAREGGFGGAVASAVRNVSPAEPKQMIVQAVKPRNSQINFEANIDAVAPRVKQVADDMGLSLDSLDSVLQATTAAKRVVRSQFDQVAGPLRRMGVDLSPIADQQIASIPRSMQIENPRAYERAVARAQAWRRVATIDEAEQLLRETNAQLEGHFAKFPMSQRKQLLADPRVASVSAKAGALRDTIYRALDHPALPQSARELNRHYGQLMEFEDALLRRSNVAKRQQPESLAEQIAGASAVADRAAGAFRMGRGALSGQYGEVIAGGADMVRGQVRREAAKFLKEQQTTDALLRRAFSQIKAAAPFERVPVRPVAGHIERGAIPMQPSPDGSYVRGVPAEPARRVVRGELPASTSATTTIELPPSPLDESSVRGVAADRVVQRNPGTGRMQRVYTSDEAGAAKRANGGYTPVLSVAPNVAASAIPDDPDSNVDDYARVGLNLAGMAALGKAAAGAAKKNAFAFAPLDGDAQARQLAFKEGKVSFARLPKQARPATVHRAILDNGGYSVQPLTGQLVEAGKPGPAMVGVFPNSNARTMSIPRDKFRPADVQRFILKNRDVFGKDANAFIGGWVDDATNTVYLDVSRGYINSKGQPDLRAATKAGELQNPGNVGNRMNGQPSGVIRNADGTWPKAQEAIFDPVGENMFPPVGNHAEFVGSPEFQSRMDEMAAVGKRAMGGENPDWWNITDGPMARVYGPENIEAMAGYTASTSPRNGPVDNLQIASEFMRRQLAGEPVRQPNWRAPSTAMGSQSDVGGFSPKAGAKFPNEGTYASNAERVRAGRPSTVRDDKVNDMFHALMGKLMGVYDQHWAKLAEAPERGIYTGAVANRIDGSMTSGRVEAYPVIENAVRDAAKRNGVDVARYSAWVWEGIRETIRSTGKLYGQTHRASAVPETTTGFNEIFEDLLQKKASHLGVSVPKLEAMLRRGDAELLSVLLATPIGAAAYSRWRADAEPTREARPQ